MQVGMIMLWQNYANRLPDEEVYRRDMALAAEAESLGFDSLWCVEHHFDSGYSMCPDNRLVLAWLAARTKTIKLATGAVILPWNQPLRVAETVSMLDSMCDGRVIFGMGRGLSRLEYEGHGVDMGESRERFDEAAEMILKALDTGVMEEHHGQYFDQARVEIHPWAKRTFSDRAYAVAMSADSAVSAGRLGVPMTTFIQGPMEQVHLPIFNAFKDSYREHHDGTPPPPVLTDLTFCHKDAAVAEEKAREHIAEYFLTCVHHYEFGGHHFDEAKGYESYAESSAALREMGMEAVTDAFVEAQIWGTPDQILEKYRARLDQIGTFEPVFSMRYGDMSFEDAEASTRLLAAEVLPGLKQLDLATAS